MTTPSLNKLSINDKWVSLYNCFKEETQTFPAIDVAKNFFNANKFKLGLLPPVVRYISEDYKLVVLERPPTRYNINFKNGAKSCKKAKKEILNIPVPWQVYVMKFHYDENRGLALTSISLYFRPEPIWSVDDQLYSPYLPNTWLSGGICVGNILDGTFHYKDVDLAFVINDIISRFWSSEFNLDIVDHASCYPVEFKKQLAEKNESIYGDRALKTFCELSIDELMSMELEKVGKNFKVSTVIKDGVQRPCGSTTMPLFAQNLLAGVKSVKTTKGFEDLNNPVPVQDLFSPLPEPEDDYEDEEDYYDEDDSPEGWIEEDELIEG